ncbi:MAG: 1-acyl-sn-glycerol-3-phosphate acyltransferase [Sandaracinus sp.]
MVGLKRPAARPSVRPPSEPPASDAVTEPSDSVTQPSKTIHKPSEPAAKPSGTIGKPSEPAAKPSEPIDKPSEPTDKPSGSAAKPSEPAAKPSDTVDKPSELEPPTLEGVLEPSPGRARPSARRRVPSVTDAELVEPADTSVHEPGDTTAAPSEQALWDLGAQPPAVDGALEDDIDLLGRDDDELLLETPKQSPLIARDDDAPFEAVNAPPTASARGVARAPGVEADLDDEGLPEARIDRLLEEASRAADDPAARMRMAEAFSELARELSGDTPLPDAEDPGLLSSAKELLSPEYYVKQWGRVAMRNRSEEVDDFGLDRAYEQRMRPVLEQLYKRWFRAQVHGVANVPAEGRALLVGNHAGALPWDGLMLQTAMRLEHPTRREVRWLAEDFVAHTPFLGAITNRLGAVRACPENAERLLAEDKLVAVFPEGEKGLGKPWAHRYEIQRFGRGGFVKLALRMKAPIVPVAIVGSEETHPLLFRTDRLARLFGVPFLPITPTFPLLGPLGLVPLPSRWVLRFGKPIDLGDEPESTLHDPVRILHLTEEVRSAVQALVKRALEDRPAAF